MKVFISWSGERSLAVANALREWLPNVIQAIKPWMSGVDIDKGARWSADIALQLSEAKVGLICLTPENLDAPWILFEAGALSKTLDKTYLCPYLFQVEPTDIKGPLIQFQATKANKDDTKKLIHTINQALGDIKISKEKLDEAFEVWWPKFEKSLKDILATKAKQIPKRDERDMIEEVLELVRGLTRKEKQKYIRTPYESPMLGFRHAEQGVSLGIQGMPYDTTSKILEDYSIGLKARYKKETPKEDEEQEEKK